MFRKNASKRTEENCYLLKGQKIVFGLARFQHRPMEPKWAGYPVSDITPPPKSGPSSFFWGLSWVKTRSQLNCLSICARLPRMDVVLPLSMVAPLIAHKSVGGAPLDKRRLPGLSPPPPSPRNRYLASQIRLICAVGLGLQPSSVTRATDFCCSRRHFFLCLSKQEKTKRKLRWYHSWNI